MSVGLFWVGQGTGSGKLSLYRCPCFYCFSPASQPPPPLMSCSPGPLSFIFSGMYVSHFYWSRVGVGCLTGQPAWGPGSLTAPHPSFLRVPSSAHSHSFPPMQSGHTHGFSALSPLRPNTAFSKALGRHELQGDTIQLIRSGSDNVLLVFCHFPKTLENGSFP